MVEQFIGCLVLMHHHYFNPIVPWKHRTVLSDIFFLVSYILIPGRKLCLLSTSHCWLSVTQVLILNELKKFLCRLRTMKGDIYRLMFPLKHVGDSSLYYMLKENFAICCFKGILKTFLECLQFPFCLILLEICSIILNPNLFISMFMFM